MNNPPLLLPRAVSALVHHIELNRAGWWEKTLNRLVVSVIWLTGENQNQLQIHKSMQNLFGLTISEEKIASVIQSLIHDKQLVKISGGGLQIPENTKTKFDQEIADAEKAENKAREYFELLVAQSCPDLNTSDIWKTFEQDILIPIVRTMGANTIQLISGKMPTFDNTQEQGFLNAFPEMHRHELKAIFAKFLGPQNDDVRIHLTGLAHAYFCVEASGVSDAVLNKIKATTEKPIRFRLFVDTNFLFSVLGLHENPSNAATNELKDLLITLKGNPQVDYYVTPATIDEAKSAIEAAKSQALEIPQSRNFTNAAGCIRMSGLLEKYIVERSQHTYPLTANDWFDPYLHSFIPLARESGVNLFNENLDAYGTRQDVIDDIIAIRESDKHLPSERQRTDKSINHDVTLWHFVKDKRPVHVESPTDAKEWILTVDFRFIRFDQKKLSTGNSNVPLCLHPTTLIHLLQFWVPRTKTFEDAILGGMRFPFLFQEFDRKAVRLSLDIMGKIGRFDGSDKISEDALVGVVMNGELRARMDEKLPEEDRLQLVRDALIEQTQVQVESAKKETTALTEALKESQESNQKKDSQINELRKNLTAKDEDIYATEENLSDKITTLESEIAQMKNREQQQKSSRTYLLYFSLVVLVSMIIGRQMGKHFSVQENIFGNYIIGIASGLVAFLCTHYFLEFYVGRYLHLNQSWLYENIRRLRKWLLGPLILAPVLAYYESIWKNLF